jgi:hypothetical protein
MQNYAGTYYSAAFRTYKFELITPSTSSDTKTTATKTPYLEARALDKTWTHILQLYHASGEYWVGYQLSGAEVQEGQSVAAFHAAFRTGADGKVSALGLEVERSLRAESWSDKLIWFEKVD